MKAFGHRCFSGTGPVPHIAFLVTSGASEQQKREWCDIESEMEKTGR